MKKILSLALAAVLLVGMVFALVSCGDIASGKYEDARGNVIEISGNKMIMEEDGVKITYKYSVDGDKILVTFDDIECEDEAVQEMVDAYKATLEAAGEQSYPFEETDNGFKMAGNEYTKK